MRSKLDSSVSGLVVCVVLVGVLGSVATVVACSGSASGTGLADGGTTSGGTSGGGTSGKGILGTGAGGMASIPTNCNMVATDDSCTACAKQPCCSQTVLCGTNVECSSIVTCAASCDSSNDTCIKACVSAHPSGQQAVSDLVMCLQTSCNAQCSDTSTTSGGTSGSGTSGSGTSGSGTSGTVPTGCLENPPDSTLCNQTPSTPFSHDCPNGPPYSGCVPSPEMLSGIYCCAQ